MKYLKIKTKWSWEIETYHGEGSKIYNNHEMKSPLKDNEYAYTIIFKEKI
jgi:hypothetical protein